MGHVHDDELRRDGQKVVAVPFALDVVEAHDHDRMVLEERGAGREVPFEASDAGCGERGGLEVEMPG